MFKSLLIAAAIIAAPASAVTVALDQTANIPDTPYLQTNQTFFIGSAAGVASAVLTISGLVADDAVVVSLNGTPLAGAGIFGPGNGTFRFTADGPAVPFTFGENGAAAGSFTSPFVLGTNTFTITFNNNNAGINPGGNPLTGGPGFYDVDASASFVPEPATWGLMIAGFGMVGVAARRRNRMIVAA